MQELIDLVKSIDRRLASMERCLNKPDLANVLTKGEYSPAEVAAMSQDYGTQPAAAKTIAMACWDRRIPDAVKNDGGHWRIPRAAVIRIFEQGIPPEQRPRRKAVCF